MKDFKAHLVLLAGVVFLGCFPANAAAPNFRWARQGGGSGYDYGKRVAVDAAGNTFVAGWNDTNSIIGGVTITNAGSFLAKYDTDGNVVWAKYFKRLGYPGVGVDAAGNCYMAGDFKGVVDFGGVLLTNNNNSATGFYDFLIAKYAGNGALIWAVQAGQTTVTNDVFELCMTVDGAGNCYVSGLYSTNAYVGTNVIGTNVLTPTASSIFIAKCDSAGNWLWAKDPVVSPTSSFPFPHAIAPSPTSGFYVCGDFQSSNVTFGSITLTNTDSSGDAYVFRCNAAGDVLWAKRAGGTGYDGGMDLAVDSLGNAYLLGSANNGVFPTLPATTIIDGFMVTNAAFFLEKYNADGTTAWVRNACDFGPDTPNFPAGAYGIAADAAGNSYVSGLFFNTAVFDGITLTNPGGKYTYPSSFVVKYDASGRALWAKNFGGGDDGDATPYGRSAIAVDATGNCSVTGYFLLTNAPFDSFTLVTAGKKDVYVARLDADPPFLKYSPTGNTVVLSWFTNQPSFQLERTLSLSSSNSWSAVTNLPAVGGLQYFVTNAVAPSGEFFRLRKP